MTVSPAKTQISLGICPVWSESLLCTEWVTKDPSFLHADSKDWSHWANAQADLSLCWAHSHFVSFVMLRPIFAFHIIACFWRQSILFCTNCITCMVLFESCGRFSVPLLTNKKSDFCCPSKTKWASSWYYAPVICNHCPPPPHLRGWAGDSGANVWGSDLSSSPAVPGLWYYTNIPPWNLLLWRAGLWLSAGPRSTGLLAGLLWMKSHCPRYSP